MADLSPVETLRAAAAKLRETAKDATPGPWGEWAVDPRPRRQVITDAGWPVAEVFERAEVAADAAWIALVHPGVAEPLADWLELEANMAEKRDNSPEGHTFHALRVARVLLGVPDA